MLQRMKLINIKENNLQLLTTLSTDDSKTVLDNDNKPFSVKFRLTLGAALFGPLGFTATVADCPVDQISFANYKVLMCPFVGPQSRLLHTHRRCHLVPEKEPLYQAPSTFDPCLCGLAK